MSSPGPTTLKAWLVQQRADFLAAYESKNLAGWIVCTGNESGDTDTVASSISYAFLASIAASAASTPSTTRYIPILLTPSTSLNLRPENLRVLSYAAIDAPATQLICSDALGGLASLNLLTQYGAKYALVDHNQLLPFFGPGEVVSVIDHHDAAQDNTLYKDANPRIIEVPTGSCASLVAVYFHTALPNNTPVPPEVADLLLSATLIDTGNFKSIAAGGKATPKDFAAKDYLWKFSTFIPKSIVNPTSDQVAAALGEIFEDLIELKEDVSKLDSIELLSRDYKEFLSGNGWRYGLSTVPMGLGVWIAREGADRGGGWAGVLVSLDAFMTQKGLDAAGILTSFKRPPPPGKKKGPHEREVVLVIKNRVLEPLFDGLKDVELLDLKKWKEDSVDAFDQITSGKGKVWRMGNDKATRKQVAPAMDKLVAELPAKV